MTNRTASRTAALGMAGAALLAIAGFTALGSLFDYPDILKEPTAEILAAYGRNPTAISAWFGVLTIGAALLAPVGIALGRIVGGTAGRWIAGLGVAAAAVQAVGLSRWVLFVPSLSADGSSDAWHTFEVLHTWLGTMLGETVGYALTAAFTVAVARVLGPRWLAVLGYCCAVLIGTGVVIPLGVGVAELTNFLGYIGWSVWLLAMAVVLWRGRAATAERLPRGASALA
ncbi:MAG TPA: DUF4386 domain-containing protein [Aldersonia sp.]